MVTSVSTFTLDRLGPRGRSLWARCLRGEPSLQVRTYVRRTACFITQLTNKLLLLAAHMQMQMAMTDHKNVREVNMILPLCVFITVYIHHSVCVFITLFI